MHRLFQRNRYPLGAPLSLTGVIVHDEVRRQAEEAPFSCDAAVRKMCEKNVQLKEELASLHCPAADRQAADVLQEQVGNSQGGRERLLQNMIDALPCSAAVLNGEGTILAVNTTWRGFADANHFRDVSYGVGMNYFGVCERVQGEDGDIALAAVRGMREVSARQRASFSLEYACHSPERQHWFVLQVGRFADEGIVQLMVLHQDISKRKWAEQILRVREERFRSVFIHSLDAILFTAPEGRILSANPAACQMFGRTEDEIRRVGRRGLIDLSDSRASSLIEERRRTGRARGEMTALRKDGTTFEAEATSAVFTNQVGAKRSVIIFRDVTERKCMENALRRSRDELERQVKERTESLVAANEALRQAYEQLEQRVTERTADLEVINAALRSEIDGRQSVERALRAAGKRIVDILESITDAFFALDENWRFTYLNTQAERLLRKSRNELWGEVIWDIFPDAVGSVFEREYRRAVTQQTEVQFETFSPDINAWVEVRAYPLQGGLSVYCCNINERRRLEQEILEISEREQQRIGRDLHDGLGQYLTGLAFMSKLLSQKLAARSAPEASKAAELYTRIAEAIHQARVLAHGLIPLELTENGLLSALQTWAQGVADVFGVACLVQGDPDMAPRSSTVATHLYRIAQEAVHNAIKHGSATKIIIRLRARGARVELRVRDNGGGMQTPNWETRGMGMRIMQHRAKMIEGILRVRSVPEQGTIVSCVIPNCFRSHNRTEQT